ncbi:curli production assembly/transport protein CsgE [Photobacterium chitinilyticum]|uniref:Curli production assembly/transport component CsgE n=1 Tax=Photobacterium chitinilyticum TaxID=2485123 RepID=A0A3S3RBY5_9GAMM|nr:curli production assembly/transport protein CsgE [Photobacterium chitinilyticum]RWX57372.1 curli production assembly protein CsgE [Photobacterium chitinilyticum]
MKLVIIALFPVLLLPAYLVEAEEGKPLENGPPLEQKNGTLDDLKEISGVVIDRTMTRLGEDFYSLFSQKLNDEFEDLEENLTVKERPTALSGSIITVLHRQAIIYRTAVSPGRDQIEAKVDDAIKTVSSYVVRWRIERYLKDTFDVDYDEI